jgi:cobalt/nickel transport system permease protein
MHIPDGLIDAPTSLAAGAVAVGGVSLSLRRAGQEILESRAPLTGLVAAFVFSAQMLNVPVAGGTSGHLLGGLLAAVLVGPWLGTLALTVVLVVQSLLFADGGVSALGLNVLNMGLVPAFAGFGLFLLARRVLPTTRAGVLAATAVAAFASVVLAAVLFTVEYALGGNGAAPVGTVGAAMIGVHVLIGIGEAVITTLTVGAVLASRPDLVHGARHLPRPAPAPPAAATEEVRA